MRKHPRVGVFITTTLMAAAIIAAPAAAVEDASPSYAVEGTEGFSAQVFGWSGPEVGASGTITGTGCPAFQSFLDGQEGAQPPFIRLLMIAEGTEFTLSEAGTIISDAPEFEAFIDLGGALPDAESGTAETGNWEISDAAVTTGGWDLVVICSQSPNRQFLVLDSFGDGDGDGVEDEDDTPEEDATPAAFVPPSEVPELDGPLELSATTIEPGGALLLAGDGFGEEETVTIVLYSDPVVLATSDTDGDGVLSAEVTIPEDTEPGTHTVVAFGADRVLGTVITVSDPDATEDDEPDTDGASDEDDGSDEAVDVAEDSEQLPETGTTAALLALTALCTLGLGVAIVARTPRPSRRA
ncbi:MAG: hypothetical protein JJT89_11600 [Nitriliruptoraceae bacterium]|nr:hypothetical protein [Nitriliruptoraceae bacterium]